MKMDRRKFLAIAGTATAAAMFSFAFQNATYEKLDARTIPGVGQVGHYSGSNDPTQDNEWLEKNIDTDAFIATCSRCGVCANVCPFKAIRFESVYFPQLTTGTRRKCPGIDNCGFCLANCPTDALQEAFKNLPPEKRTPAAKKKPWYEGPSNDAERNLSGLKR